ncbi:GNAT family N-acetyltransferase [Bacillus nitratireducens]|uniref:GNAT family N-acetyltransferase n=1 Tax=Bacillus nitratireducens TaxID=2026193 RepID=A0ABU6PBG4_9BACI|nr:GNAT family N-acetyltransferase [Bacillus nitratireducens]PEX43915.1 N-acetyltransferase [Bacillus cereus]MDR4171704.1 GNAT family N-acetyltransferase [Bacillus nitratireducens]MED4678647.1 GNAT family N-acetyltransferase [Bacillus nitratireducens]PFM36517.1 N-acetyltransferase [Bacillus cereus]PFP94025.1 N-acetyltransferase [Bacillus cereus]
MMTIEQLEKHFKIRRNASSIMIKENNAEVFTEEQLEEIIQYCVVEAEKDGIEELQFEISSKSPNYDVYKKCFETYSFEYITENMIVCKDIYEVEDIESEIDFKLIEEIGEDAFYSLWNEVTGEQIDYDQFVNTMLQEIGGRWKEHCLTASIDEEPIGIVIPHIERGTLEEGKLMHFAVAPNMRNKGYEMAFFTGAMFVLKEIGASYYIGETNVQNEWMKDVFEKNGCQQLSSTERYVRRF